MSQYLSSFVNSFGKASAEAGLWVSVIQQAKLDLNHKRREVREDAYDFFFNPFDDRLANLMHMLGLNGHLAKEFARRMLK